MFIKDENGFAYLGPRGNALAYVRHYFVAWAVYDLNEQRITYPRLLLADAKKDAVNYFDLS